MINYENLYSNLDAHKYHVSNYTANEFAIIPLLNRTLLHTNMKEAKVIVIGCGTCASLPLLNRLTHGNSYGMEVSSNAIAIAEELKRGKNCKESPCIQKGSLVNIPWSDNFFDIAISFDVFEHIHSLDIDRSIAEMWRVTTHFAFIGIATGPSRRNNVELHLSRHNHSWWKAKFEKVGWHSVHIPLPTWKRLWYRPTRFRLWNKGKICENVDQNVISKPCGSLFFAFAKTQFDATLFEQVVPLI